MKLLLKVACLFLGFAVSTPVLSYTVENGDTLIGIAKRHNVNYLEICKLNRIANCNNIHVGQELEIPTASSPNKEQPSAQKQETALIPTESGIAGKKQNSVLAEVKTAALSLIRSWKCVGCDPVLKGWVRKNWLSTEEVSLAPQQEVKLRLQGLDDSQIEEVKQVLKEKRYTLTFRPKDYLWASMAFGSGMWGETRNATGDDIPVFALPPTSKGYQVDLALGCGNPAVNRVKLEKPKPVLVTLQEEEKRVSCEKIGAFWAQVSEHGVSGTARFACLFQINNNWKAGPTIGFGGSRFDDHTWIELQSFIGGGFELRGKNIAGFDAIEFVVMVGTGSSAGHSADGLTEKLKSSGMDAQLAMQLRKQFHIDEKTSVTVRFMPFASIPLTGVEADILWKNMVVKQENGRHLTIGAVMRFEFQRKGLGFKPEITLGIWRMSDIDNPIGWKFLVGASTIDNVWRIGAGLQFPGPIWLVEVEYNPAWGWLQLNAETASRALHTGATPTCKALKMERCSKPEGEERAATAGTPTTPTPKESAKSGNVVVSTNTAVVSAQKRWCGNRGSCLVTETAPTSQEVQVVRQSEYRQEGNNAVAEGDFWKNSWNG